MLMGEDQGEPVAARLGEQILEGPRERELIVGLVHVERGVGTILFRERRPPHAPLPDPCDDEGAQEPRGVLAQRPLHRRSWHHPRP